MDLDEIWQMHACYHSPQIFILTVVIKRQISLKSFSSLTPMIASITRYPHLSAVARTFSSAGLNKVSLL